MIIRVIDFETTGLPPDAKIVEVATVDLVNDEGAWKRGRMWSSLVNPGCPIPPEISAVHHITDDMVATAPRFEDLQGQICDGSPVFAAHNARFEQALWPNSHRWCCTYKGALTAWPEAPAHSNQALRYWLKLKLADDAGPPHRAAGDAYVTAAIARRLLSIPGTTVEEWIEISSRPALLPRFTFGKHAMTPIADLPGDYLSWVIDNIKDNEDVLHTAKHQLAQRRAATKAAT